MRTNFSLVVALACFAFPACAQDQVFQDHGLSGVWFVENPDQPLRPANGDVPLNDAGRARMAENQAWLKAPHPPTKNDLTACIPQPAPHLLSGRFPVRIVEKKMPGARAISDFVLFLFEHNHTFRFVYMNEDHKNAEDVLPTFAGNSTGHWDGGALVVDDRYFMVGPPSMLDATGLPISEKLHAVERYVKRGDVIDVTITIDDPDMYTRSWTAKRTLVQRAGEDIAEYACGVGDLSTRETRAAKAGAKP